MSRAWENFTVEDSDIMASIPTIKDIQLGVDTCPQCQSPLVESKFQRRQKRKVPANQLSPQQLLGLRRRPVGGMLLRSKKSSERYPSLLVALTIALGSLLPGPNLAFYPSSREFLSLLSANSDI